MAGIYLHIPYCKQACHYCDFHFSTNLKTRSDLIECMQLEMEQRRNFLPEDTIETIYFGGGTPSLLETSELQKLIGKIRSLWTVSPKAEITLEANPDDLTKETLDKLKNAGVNRLSIGIQSFEQTHLEWMNRGHNAEQAIACIDRARAAGFENLTVDLIYGFPGLTEDQWQNNINTIIERRLPHISCYSLTIEKGTALNRFIEKGQESEPDESEAVRHFEMLTQSLQKAGYDHYEVSNFALPGFVSKHNHAYWTGAAYLGVGPSAHSFNGSQRCWNVRNNHTYIRDIRSGTFAPECESIDPNTAYNEYVLTRLRTSMGVDLSDISKQFGVDFNAKFKPEITRLLESEKIHFDGQNLRLTQKGFLWADDIAARFFILAE